MQKIYILYTFPNLVEFNTKLVTAFEGRRERVQILSPEGEELLDAQAAQGVVSRVTDTILLSHRHDLVIDVQRVLRKQITLKTPIQGQGLVVMQDI